MLADWEPPTGGRRSRWVPVVGGLALALLVALAVRGTGGGLAGVEVGDLDGAAPAARELETREPAQGVVIRVWEVAGQVQVSASVDGEVAQVPLPGPPPDGRPVHAVTVLAGTEASPATLVAIRSTSAVNRVSVDSPTGTDETVPVEGVAVLAVRGWDGPLAVTADGDGGHELTSGAFLEPVRESIDRRPGRRSRLLDRTTSGGVRLVASVRQCSPLSGDACAADVRSLRVAASTREDVLALSVTDQPEDPDATLAVLNSGVVGPERGDPATVVVALAADGVARVRARFGDGGVDVAEVVDGWAVLAGADATAGTVRLEAIDDAGAILATVEADASAARRP
ncbi:hypothetical protein BH20ACT8_BH20ACT8_15020 [soil metagenome]